MLLDQLFTLTEGISSEELSDVLARRLEARYPDTFQRYNLETIADAVMQTAEFHAGAEELGTSDIGAMLRDILRRLESRRVDQVHKKKQGVGEGQEMSLQQLATISDEALDNQYHYGRSTPGNTFGWQANLMSAAYAKRMIDAGVTDIEKIADAIHKGWNVTAQKFVADPDQFDDTEKLRQAGKLDAKLQQRAKLMKINYAQLDNEEQEKDRVVARALLQAMRGQSDLNEGNRFDEPLTGYHIVYRKNNNPVANTPSFETRDAAQKYLMTRMFANHQDYQVVHTADVGVTETSDYSRRREREEAIISGRKPARKRAPAQTSDYARRREQEKNKKQGVAEGSGRRLHFKSLSDWERAVSQAWPGRVNIEQQSEGIYAARLTNDYLVGVFAENQGGWLQPSSSKQETMENAEEAHTNEAAPATRRSMPYSVWQTKSADDQRFIKQLYPDLVITGQPRVRAAKPKKEKIDYQEIARKIEQVVGSTFPDGDPIDLLIPYMRRRWGLEWDLGQHLDRAAKRHLGARSYDDYLATLWDQVADDELLPDRVTRDNNPWRAREGV
jgi:hypothetical protein